MKFQNLRNANKIYRFWHFLCYLTVFIWIRMHDSLATCKYLHSNSKPQCDNRRVYRLLNCSCVALMGETKKNRIYVHFNNGLNESKNTDLFCSDLKLQQWMGLLLSDFICCFYNRLGTRALYFVEILSITHIVYFLVETLSAREIYRSVQADKIYVKEGDATSVWAIQVNHSCSLNEKFP